MTTIHDLPLKDQPDGQDEIELQESGGGSSRRASIASALVAGLPVVAPVVHLGLAVGGIRLEAVSLSRVQLVQGGTPVLLIDSNGSWLSGWSADDWQIQRQTWPGTPVYASAGAVDSGLGFPAANSVGIAAGGVEVARFVAASDAVNFLTVQPSATGEPVKRCKAVMGLPRFIVGADASDLAAETARFCRAALSLVPSFHSNLVHQLQGISHGLSIEEVMWERMARGPLAGAVVPVDLIDRPMHRFTFNSGRLHVLRPNGESMPAPRAKFLVMCHGSKDTPWGRALLDKVYWPYKVKLHGMQYYSVFIEKFAQPLIMAIFDRTGKAEKDQLLEAEAHRVADMVQTEYSLSFSSDISLKFLEAARSGSVSYEAFLAFMSREQAIVLLGEVDTSGLAKGPGSFAKNRVSNEVRLETLRFDGHELGTHLIDGQPFAPDGPDQFRAGCSGAKVLH